MSEPVRDEQSLEAAPKAAVVFWGYVWWAPWHDLAEDWAGRMMCVATKAKANVDASLHGVAAPVSRAFDYHRALALEEHRLRDGCGFGLLGSKRAPRPYAYLTRWIVLGDDVGVVRLDSMIPEGDWKQRLDAFLARMGLSAPELQRPAWRYGSWCGGGYGERTATQEVGRP